VRKPEEYFGDIPDEKAPKEMIDLAVHIIDTMAGHFDPEKFDDRNEDARCDLIKRKAVGEKIAPAEHPRPKATTNVLEALRASLEGTQKRPPAARSTGGPREEVVSLQRATRLGARRRVDFVLGQHLGLQRFGFVVLGVDACSLAREVMSVASTPPLAQVGRPGPRRGESERSAPTQ
jgi:hypothetical protein